MTPYFCCQSVFPILSILFILSNFNSCPQPARKKPCCGGHFLLFKGCELFEVRLPALRRPY